MIQMPSPTARATARRERLLDAAIRVFGRHGYQKATLSAIADEAGLNKATLYYYFPGGKEQLVGQALCKHADDSFRSIQASMVGSTTPADRLRAYLRGRVQMYIDKIRGNGMTFEALFELKTIAEAQCAEWMGREIGMLAGLLQACQPQADLDWQEHARALRAALKGMLIDIRPDASDADVARRAAAFESWILRAWA
jgi:AcrR family transcriptional regulator